MAKIFVGNIPNGIRDTEEQREVGDHVSIYCNAGFHILPAIRP